MFCYVKNNDEFYPVYLVNNAAEEVMYRTERGSVNVILFIRSYLLISVFVYFRPLCLMLTTLWPRWLTEVPLFVMTLFCTFRFILFFNVSSSSLLVIGVWANRFFLLVHCKLYCVVCTLCLKQTSRPIWLSLLLLNSLRYTVTLMS